MGAQAQESEVRQKAFPVQFASLADLFSTQADQGKELRRKRVDGAALEGGAVPVFAPYRQHQSLQAMVKQIEKTAGQVAAFVVTQGLLGVERGQW
ncbi:hypothetical protein D3C85_1620970 [compost metagenome]